MSRAGEQSQVKRATQRAIGPLAPEIQLARSMPVWLFLLAPRRQPLTCTTMTMDRVGQFSDMARTNTYPLREYCVKFATRPSHSARKFQRGLHLSCELFEVAHERLIVAFDTSPFPRGQGRGEPVSAQLPTTPAIRVCLTPLSSALSGRQPHLDS